MRRQGISTGTVSCEEKEKIYHAFAIFIVTEKCQIRRFSSPSSSSSTSSTSSTSSHRFLPKSGNVGQFLGGARKWNFV